MSRRVHEVEEVGFFTPILHDYGQWCTLKTNLAINLVLPVICPLVLTVQIPAATSFTFVAIRRLMCLLDDHVT